MKNEIAYFEIVAKDAARLHRFYEATFDWKLESGPMPNYVSITTGGASALRGGIRQEEGAKPDRVMYVRVANLEETLARVTKAGGKVLIPPMQVAGVTFALFLDPEGNTMGIIL